jgi:predicted extracellular nuclease
MATITQWNFNSPTPDNAVGTGTANPSVGTGTASLLGTTATFATGFGTETDNSGWNTTGYPASGTDNKTEGVQFSISTVGYTGVSFNFDIRHSNTSANTVVVQYSTDGTNFVDFETFTVTQGDTFFNRSVNFSSIAALNNNPNAAFRVVTAFDSTLANYRASTPTSTYGGGTLRFDNVILTGTEIATPPSVNLSVNPNAGTEAGTIAITVTATTSAPVSGNQTVGLGVTGTDITASDYTLSSTTITIPSGQTTGTATFTVVDDSLVESTETATLTINSPSAGITLGTTTSQGITITDNDTPANTTPNVQITEYMYDGANREIIEFTNLGTTAVDMTGWSFDDDSRIAGTVSLSAFGIVQPGESVILAEATEAEFRTAWAIPATVKVIGGLTANLGRADEINLFDNNNQLVDRLTYGDAVIPGTIRTQNASGWTEAGNLAPTQVNAQWVLSTVADAQNSRTSTGGDIGNPGSYVSSSVPTAGVTITQSEGSTNVTEGGATDAYTVVLRKQPTADVTININPGTQTTITPTALTFTPSNWNVAQSVTVAAVDDTVFEGSHTGAIAHSTTSTDAAYNGITIPSVTANITDNDTISVSGIQITEYLYSGNSGEFVEFTNIGTTPVDMTGWSFADTIRTPGTFSLSAFGTVQPGESVILTDIAEATFRAAWGLPASVKVIGGQTIAGLGRADEINLYNSSNQLVDRLTYGDERFAGTIRTQNASGWTGVGNLAPTDINAQWVLSTAADAQNSYASTAGDIGNPGVYNTGSAPTPGVTITQSEGSTNVTEGGTTDTYTVVLKSQPSANVTVNIGPDSQTTTSAAALTFTTANWNVAQTVTVTAVDDQKGESSIHNSSITHTVASGDANYNGITVATVNANVTDNDFGSLKKISSFAGAGAEITAFDPVSKRLFVIDGTANVQIINFADPANPTPISAINLTAYGISANSVAVKNGVVAIAIEAANPNNPGKVVFYDTAGTFIKDVTVGVLPDMITFSPDGKKVLTANEGQPTTTSDPVGSVSIIDISQGVAAATVTTASFTSFDGQEATLRS